MILESIYSPTMKLLTFLDPRTVRLCIPKLKLKNHLLGQIKKAAKQNKILRKKENIQKQKIKQLN